jgi:hypothetical protein
MRHPGESDIIGGIVERGESSVKITRVLLVYEMFLGVSEFVCYSLAPGATGKS